MPLLIIKKIIGETKTKRDKSGESFDNIDGRIKKNPVVASEILLFDIDLINLIEPNKKGIIKPK